LLIAQVTDIHLGFEPNNPAEFNRKRLDQVIKQLNAMTPRPDFLLATGDLTEFGDIASFRRLKNALSQIDFPVWPMVGNHDLRANFTACFPDVPAPDGSMFIWAPIPEKFRHLGSVEFSKLLLARAKVAVAPGLGFGEHGDGHVRIALVENNHRIRQALRGIRGFLAGDNLGPVEPEKEVVPA
jgi:hypothetical protein